MGHAFELRDRFGEPAPLVSEQRKYLAHLARDTATPPPFGDMRRQADMGAEGFQAVITEFANHLPGLLRRQAPFEGMIVHAFVYPPYIGLRSAHHLGAQISIILRTGGRHFFLDSRLTG